MRNRNFQPFIHFRQQCFVECFLRDGVPRYFLCFVITMQMCRIAYGMHRQEIMAMIGMIYFFIRIHALHAKV